MRSTMTKKEFQIQRALGTLAARWDTAEQLIILVNKEQYWLDPESFTQINSRFWRLTCAEERKQLLLDWIETQLDDS